MVISDQHISKKETRNWHNKATYKRKENSILYSQLRDPRKEPGASTFYDPNKNEQESRDRQLGLKSKINKEPQNPGRQNKKENRKSSI